MKAQLVTRNGFNQLISILKDELRNGGIAPADLINFDTIESRLSKVLKETGTETKRIDLIPMIELENSIDELKKEMDRMRYELEQQQNDLDDWSCSGESFQPLSTKTNATSLQFGIHT
eukprot:TRINITY_DN552_c0_g1_i2.p1 TRINITY_DN552_c0_g1~~TRINITY_DN552_c0_g1_i2.p1  ORF type:complete len:118 (-),score=15.67 TRINITY_DN552_c0_g1_i2:337-690(-)